MFDDSSIDDVLHVLASRGPAEAVCDTAWISLEPNAFLVVPVPDSSLHASNASNVVHVVGCRPTDADDGSYLWLF